MINNKKDDPILIKRYDKDKPILCGNDLVKNVLLLLKEYCRPDDFVKEVYIFPPAPTAKPVEPYWCSWNDFKKNYKYYDAPEEEYQKLDYYRVCPSQFYFICDHNSMISIINGQLQFLPFAVKPSTYKESLEPLYMIDIMGSYDEERYKSFEEFTKKYNMILLNKAPKKETKEPNE